MVNTSKTAFDNNADWIAVTEADQVFNGRVAMNSGRWTTIYFDTPFAYDGTSNVALIMDDNTGSWYFNNMSCRVSSTDDYQAIYVYNDGLDFDPTDPANYNGNRLMVKNQISLGITSSSVTQTIALSAGWNWFSTNLNVTLDNLKAALVRTLPNSTVTIISQGNGSAIYNGSTWRGALTSLDLNRMYMIQVGTNGELTLEGTPINPAEHIITIVNGSNWIAFPLSESMTPANAFDGFAVSGDVISSQNGSSIYNGSVWRGPLNTLEPGKGYIYRSAATSNRTFVFPTGAK